MELAVGKDIFSVCGKCGDTWHVIVAVEGVKVTKVQCKFCGGYHRYKRAANDTATKETKPKAPSRPAATGTTKAGKKQTRVVTPKRDEPRTEPNLALPVRDYAMSGTYQTGERIEHPKFGQGVVEAFPSPGKMDVFFEDGRRTLAYGRVVASA